MSRAKWVMDMYLMSWATGGMIPYSSSGKRPSIPRMTWVAGLVKSRSRRPTLCPVSARRRARVEATMLFPTPPFPLETAMIPSTPSRRRPMRPGRGSIICFHSLDGCEEDPSAL